MHAGNMGIPGGIGISKKGSKHNGEDSEIEKNYLIEGPFLLDLITNTNFNKSAHSM
jgi:hypothetical protein